MQKAIDNLKKKLLSLSTLVEEAIRDAVRALVEHDAELAERVITEDARVDEMEVEVKEECLKILALHQPVAVDLRYIVATPKINNDLERVGDLAVNIAERTQFISTQAAPPPTTRFSNHGGESPMGAKP